MIIILFVLFALSAFFPVYTYAIYPLVLRLMPPKKEYKRDCLNPSVSVIIFGKNAEEKVRNVEQCNYPILEIVIGDYNSEVNGQIIVFTDTETRLDSAAIQSIVEYFADDRVGCVVGHQLNPEGNSLFWKYETKVKQLESRIGCVSGAPEGLFAVRKSDMPNVGENIMNKPFYIATKIAENGKAVVYQKHAKAYEGTTDGTNFKKHVEYAAGYWQCFILFPRMLGSFVYVSHRVMKWFVWLNMVLMLIISGVLGAFGMILMTVLFWLQIVCYSLFLLLGRRGIGGPIGKLLSIGHYFVMLNVSYFVGLFRVKKV